MNKRDEMSEVHGDEFTDEFDQEFDLEEGYNKADEPTLSRLARLRNFLLNLKENKAVVYSAGFFDGMLVVMVVLYLTRHHG